MGETFIYQDSAPYPPIRVSGKNLDYAEAMLGNIGSCNSEMSAVSLYFYNSIVTEGPFAEVSGCFHKISIVEMHHLEMYGRLAMLLGADPRLWSCQSGRRVYWSPGCNRYPDHIDALLENAIQGENDAVRKYQAQTEWIQDVHITAVLNRIILDEKIHIRIFRQLLEQVKCR